MKKRPFIILACALLVIAAAALTILSTNPSKVPGGPEDLNSLPPAPPAESGLTEEPDTAEEPDDTGSADPLPEDEPPPPDPKEVAIDSYLSKMDISQKVAQMFMIRCGNDWILSEAAELQPGAWILFSQNTRNENPVSLSSLIAEASAAAGIPMIISVDEEGGTVSRIGQFPQYSPSPFPSPQRLFSRGGLELAGEDALAKSKLLLELGFNVNLAPVCDVSVNKNDFINARSFGRPAEETAEYISAVVSAMNEENIGAVLKHFPGYGNNADTHTGSALDKRSLESFKTSDFLPFKAGIEAGAGGVLISHNVVECMGPLPASLNPEAHRILREELEFTGVILTDDLVMRAITDLASPGDAAVLAVLAGNDMLIASDYRIQIEAVIKAVADGQIEESTIDSAVRRILAWKYDLGIIE